MAKKKRHREAEATAQPATVRLEVYADGRWSNVGDFADDGAALRALVTRRDAQPQARVRIVDATDATGARVLLDMPPVHAG
jgi:hypothetical protein